MGLFDFGRKRIINGQEVPLQFPDISSPQTPSPAPSSPLQQPQQPVSSQNIPLKTTPPTETVQTQPIAQSISVNPYVTPSTKPVVAPTQVEQSFSVPDFSDEDLSPHIPVDEPSVSDTEQAPVPDSMKENSVDFSVFDEASSVQVPEQVPIANNEEASSSAQQLADLDKISKLSESFAPRVVIPSEEEYMPEPEVFESDEDVKPIETTVFVKHNNDVEVFVEKESYKKALLSLADIEGDVRKATDHLERVLDDEAIVTAKMSEWHDVMDLIQARLIMVDSKMFDKGDTNG